MSIYVIVLSSIAGFFIAKFFSGKKEGEQGKIKSLIFHVEKYTIHIHHWLIALILLVLIFLLGFYNDLIFGLLVGIIIQGLTYNDFYKIVY